MSSDNLKRHLHTFPIITIAPESINREGSFTGDIFPGMKLITPTWGHDGQLNVGGFEQARGGINTFNRDDVLPEPVLIPIFSEGKFPRFTDWVVGEATPFRLTYTIRNDRYIAMPNVISIARRTYITGEKWAWEPVRSYRADRQGVYHVAGSGRISLPGEEGLNPVVRLGSPNMAGYLRVFEGVDYSPIKAGLSYKSARFERGQRRGDVWRARPVVTMTHRSLDERIESVCLELDALTVEFCHGKALFESTKDIDAGNTDAVKERESLAARLTYLSALVAEIYMRETGETPRYSPWTTWKEGQLEAEDVERIHRAASAPIEVKGYPSLWLELIRMKKRQA